MEENKADEKKATVTEHLEELRRRILYAAVALLLGIGVGWSLSGHVLRRITSDFDLVLVQIGITEVFMTQFRIGVIIGLAVALPLILYQIAAFVVPGLTRGERALFYLFLPVALLLFLVGAAFAYLVVIPFTMRFFLEWAANQGFDVILPPMKVIDFVMGLVLPMGFVFEMPLLVAVFARLGVISARLLGRFRKYAVLLIFIMAAVLTPPDPVSQLLLAAPMLLLYEASILVARVAGKKRG